MLNHKLDASGETWIAKLSTGGAGAPRATVDLKKVEREGRRNTFASVMIHIVIFRPNEKLNYLSKLNVEL